MYVYTINKLTKLCDFGLQAFNFILKLGLCLQNDLTTTLYLLKSHIIYSNEVGAVYGSGLL